MCRRLKYEGALQPGLVLSILPYPFHGQENSSHQRSEKDCFPYPPANKCANSLRKPNGTRQTKRRVNTWLMPPVFRVL